MITSIHIHNFRGINSAALTNLCGRVLVTGLNGSGKTAIQNALQVAFTGTCNSQTGKRIQNADLIGDNGREASVVLGLDLPCGPAELQLQITAKQQSLVVKRDGKQLIAGSPDDVRRALWKRMGGDFDLADAGLHTRQYLLSDSVLQHIAKVSGGIDQAQLESLCGEQWGWLNDFADSHDKIPVYAGAGFTHEALAKVGDLAYADRTNVTRRSKQLVTQIETAPAIDTKGMTLDQLPDLRTALATLRTERDGLQRQLGAATGSKHTQDEIDAGIAECEATLAGLKPPALSLAELQAERDRMQQAHNIEQRAAGSLFDRIANIEKQIVDATQRSGACPTCKRAYKAADTAKAVEALQKDLAPLKAEYAEKAPYVQSLLDSLPPIDDRIRECRSAWDDYNSEKRRAEARLEAFQKATATGDTATIEADIKALDTRIARGEGIIKALNEQQGLATLENDLAEANAEIEHLNWAVAAFRDCEITNQLTSGGAGQFIERINERLADFGIVLHIEGTGASSELHYRRRGKARSLANASNGEILVCQLAMAEVLGQGLVLLDNLDALDAEWKLMAFERINQIEGSCVMSAAWGTGVTLASSGLIEYLEPATVVWVEDGTVRVVEPELAEVA